MIRYYYDEDAENPREWDNASVIAHWHRRYPLGDRKATDEELTALRYGGLDGLTRHIERQEGSKVLAIELMGLLDHSELHVWLGGGAHWSDTAGWDSGTVGFAYVLANNVCGTPPEHATDVLRQDVETFDAYLRGECYGYVISTPSDPHAESCWGFIGDLDYCKEEARADAAHLNAEYETVELSTAVQSALC